MDHDRKHTRAPLGSTVKFYDWSRPLQAEGGEVSPEGIFLRTREALSEGALITLRLCIPGCAEAFTVLGRVVHTVRGGGLRTAGLGVRFIDIAAAGKEAIARYVARRTLQPV